MSIFFDFDVGPAGRRFRRAVDCDRHDIEVFWKPTQTEPLFGEVNIGSLIELSTLSICMIDGGNKVTGFMALSDHPPLLCVDPADWEMWIRNTFECFYLSRNTLFLHFICCVDEVHEFFVHEAFTSVFKHDAYLNYILLLVPIGCPKACYLRFPVLQRCSVFRPKIDGEHDLLMLVAFRQEFAPKLKIRRAVEEDNDDIVEILDKICPRMKELYGEYYISEIIGRHRESVRKIIVAEHEDCAVGVMCLNSNINYGRLQRIYELKQFNGLKKATPLEKERQKRSNKLLSTFGYPIMNGKWSPFSRMRKLETIAHKDNKKTAKMINIHKIRKSSRVNYGLEVISRSLQEIMLQIPRSTSRSDNISCQYSPTQTQLPQPTDFSVIDLLEEDPFDYEIVNIDTSLFSLPETLSIDQLCGKRPKNRSKKRLSIKNIRRKNKKLSVLSSMERESEDTVYSGSNNAFMIELFGFRDDIHHRHAFDMLEAAFEVMKDYDYCIIQLPFAEPAMSLLQHFCYAPTKYYYCCEHALYVAHRSSLLGKLRVREAEFSDVPQIAHFMQNMEGKETIWTIENAILHDEEHSVFVFQCGTKIIGLGVLERPEQIDFIRAKFNIDSYHIHKYHTSGLTCGFTVLKTMLVYTVFEPHYRFFARDMLRLSNNNVMLWMTDNRNKLEAHKVNSMISAMVPLVPRRSEINCTNIPELKMINKLAKKVLPFSTWYMSRKFSSLPKMIISTRIVIVGASRAAMAFLEALLFSDASSYMTFTNVTLISRNGPYVQHMKPYADYMFPKYRTMSDQYLKSVPYTYYVNLVHGTVVEIDKTNKFIKLASESEIHYDLLYLMFGKQYQHPDYLNDVIEKQKQIREGNASYQPLDAPRSSEEIRTTTEYLPDNVFIVNDIVDANKSVEYVKNFIWHNDSYKIIVYGAYIDTYCCLATLLEMDVNPKNIYFVEPFPPEDSNKTRVSVFCNVYVDQTMKQVLDRLKVNVYRSYYFKSWTVGADNHVNQVQFLSHLKLIQLDCSAFFYYGKRGINTKAFVAIHKSGIGYDGGILIDHEFRTKDPNVYAAGPGTRYFRRYYAENKMQKYYDSYEVGVKLGTLIRNKLDPLFNPRESIRKKSTKTFEVKTQFGIIISETSNTISSRKKSNGSDRYIQESKEPLEEAVEILPDFKKPIVTHCRLPGGLQYLEVRAPGIKEPHYYVQSLSFNGHVLETNKVGYFKLHLTTDSIVDGITCLTPEKDSLENFINLYGWSTVALNNLQIRFTAKKLDCLYEFFRQPWAYFLYIDKVDELFEIVRELLPKGENQGKTLREALCSSGEILSDPSNRINTRMQIGSNFESSSYIEAIMECILDWLAENDILLPMFLRPDQTAQYMHDLNNHPAFRKKN